MAARKVRLAIAARGNNLAQAGDALGVEERAALVGRAGNEHQQLAIAFEGDVQPLAGGAAVGVVQDGCAVEHVGLLEVVFRHGDAPGGGACGEGDDLIVARGAG